VGHRISCRSVRGIDLLRTQGIYYIDRQSGEAQLHFFDFATGRSTTGARGLGEMWFGLTVSPNGRTILNSRLDSALNELMLVEDFR
jgi:hypothetical protein